MYLALLALLAYLAFISIQVIILETFMKSNPNLKPFKVGTFPQKI